ncbi:hypothetical protein [Amycolatopsis solani]|uniref:hypothetical protein n=1 Tax=Amycolatopsis solani TaxID=3028615 RepID=UPI0025B07430|nr:hypothetical protein [Amycolatopsis sp. MEP2-6]
MTTSTRQVVARVREFGRPLAGLTALVAVGSRADRCVAWEGRPEMSTSTREVVARVRECGLPPEPRADRGVAWKDVPK